MRIYRTTLSEVRKLIEQFKYNSPFYADRRAEDEEHTNNRTRRMNHKLEISREIRRFAGKIDSVISQEELIEVLGGLINYVERIHREESRLR